MKRLSRDSQYRRKNISLQYDGNKYYIVNYGSDKTININKIFPSLLKIHKKKKALKAKENKTVANVKSSLRKTKTGKVVAVKGYTRKLKDIVTPLFSSGTDVKSLKRILKQAKFQTVKHVVKKYNYDTAKDKKKIALKTKRLFTKIVKPIYFQAVKGTLKNKQSKQAVIKGLS